MSATFCVADTEDSAGISFAFFTFSLPFGSSQMILFSACCICGLIGGILNFQFLRAVTKKTSSLYPLHLASMSFACIGIGVCTLSSWLTCRLASYEQRRMFSEREHSLHHSHEMAEKVSALEILSCCIIWKLQSTVSISVFRETLRNWISGKVDSKAKNRKLGGRVLCVSLQCWVHLVSI